MQLRALSANGLSLHDVGATLRRRACRQGQSNCGSICYRVVRWLRRRDKCRGTSNGPRKRRYFEARSTMSRGSRSFRQRCIASSELDAAETNRKKSASICEYPWCSHPGTSTSTRSTRTARCRRRRSSRSQPRTWSARCLRTSRCRRPLVGYRYRGLLGRLRSRSPHRLRRRRQASPVDQLLRRRRRHHLRWLHTQQTTHKRMPAL